MYIKRKYIAVIVILQIVIIWLLIPYFNIVKTAVAYGNQSSNFIIALSGPLVAGLVIWFLGEHVASKKIKRDAITGLMTYRGGDYGSTHFRESLNKVAIVFHNDPEIRQEVRHLYEVANNQSLQGEIANRTIVGLIYKLCQRNGFKGLTEYDIDQSFLNPESQTPVGNIPTGNTVSSSKEAKRTKNRYKKTAKKN